MENYNDYPHLDTNTNVGEKITSSEMTFFCKAFITDLDKKIDEFKSLLPSDILVSITLSEDSNELAIKGKYLALSVYKINPA